jgi:methionine-S-sulfoxide reductase
MQTEEVVLGGGCFWCTEAVFKMLKGVESVEPGYAGGKIPNPTYEQVSMGNTGHIEVIRIVYDPDQLSFEEILHVFFTTHDPTTPGRQGNDVGEQYSSVIFYTTPQQEQKSKHYISVISKSYDKPIVTKVLPLEKFYFAEDYHKNYYENNKSAGYCQLVIAPKVEKVEEKFQHLLK